MNSAVLLNITNTLATTFFAVARCMCVARPLHFKDTFTRNRTVVFNIGSAVFTVVTYTPIMVNIAMLPRTDTKTNLTRISLWLSKDREAIKDGVFLVTNTLLPFLTEIIIIVCVFVMANSLRSSLKFRQASSLTAKSVVFRTRTPASSEKIQDSITTASDKKSNKDQRVVQQVILISLFYICCNTAKILLSSGGFIELHFRTIVLYFRMYISAYSLQKCLEVGNASVNTFIYYSYNTKFRKHLHLLFYQLSEKSGNDSN
jgi:hypothetical protein